MGKKSKSQAASGAQNGGAAATPASGLPFLAGASSVDQTVASLFEKSVSGIHAIWMMYVCG